MARSPSKPAKPVHVPGQSGLAEAPAKFLHDPAAATNRLGGVESRPATQAPARPAQPAQQRLAGLDPRDRIAGTQAEEELLDIPAFLRRQAN